MLEPIDLHRNEAPAIIEKAPAVSGSVKTKTDVLTQLNGLKIDIPESISEQEKKVKALVIKGLLEDGEDASEPLSVKFISKGVFAVRGNYKDIDFIVNEKGENIINISTQRERVFVENGDVLKLMGLIEKGEKGEHFLYREGSDVSINQDSLEYLNMWKQIAFEADIFGKLINLKNNIKFSRGFLENYIERGSFKFEDLELVKSKGLLENPKDYEYAIQEIRKRLVSQCGDRRLIKLGIGIKESDLKKYKENKAYGLTDDLVLECFRVLPDNMMDLSGKK
ncbi:MAG: hypothetical protein PHZ26_01935 [Candidatus Gracilibacteria bacterium]|nr:hypothetical protein [Candidatus Gracilibacteria bacterium]MDD2908494.1 hypothetical protein [Candidatus Gracilibacteria bacterium]